MALVSLLIESRSPARATGHVDYLAGDERRLVAAQKGDQIGDVARHPGAAHRDLAGAFLLPFLGVAAEPDRRRPCHLGIDEARRDGIGCDAVAAELDRQRARHALQPSLYCRMVGLPAIAERRNRGQVNDAAPAALDHLTLCRARG